MNPTNKETAKEEGIIRQPIITIAGHVDHGKCVAGDTIIPTGDGTLITAKELFDNNYDRKKAEIIEGDIAQEVDNIEIFTNYGTIIKLTKASHIWKRKKEKLIEVRTAHGDAIKTTPEHPYFKFSINGDVQTKAEDLKVGDYIAIPKRINSIDKEDLREKLK